MLQVLVVEDQDVVREVIAEVVADIGVPVSIEQASSLAEARDVLGHGDVDAMVTDLSLGDGQSLDLIAELRAGGSQLPVMLVSGFLSEERVKRARELGVDQILSKPFVPQTLLSFLKAALKLEDVSGVGEADSVSDTALKLLPHVFQMDRNIGLLFRMFTEMPRHKNVSQVCVSTLELAIEMVLAKRGFLAFYERDRNELVIVSSQDIGKAKLRCAVHETAFEELLHNEESVLFTVRGKPCWPGINAKKYVALPVSMEGIPVGVLCLMDFPGKATLDAGKVHMLGLLLKNLDTLLDNRAVHAALADSMRQTLIGLVRSLEARDRYTKDHSLRVSEISVQIASEMQLDDETLELIKTGALMHDIGKVGIADDVLLKPGRFTDHEYRIMQAHPAIGDSILKHMDALLRERLIVRHHHERWDGNGYPDKLAKEDIPLTARIVCVADAIDAMTTSRCYRNAKPLAFCREQLRLGSGKQFDPKVVKAAIALIDRDEIRMLPEAEMPKVNEDMPPFSELGELSHGARP